LNLSKSVIETRERMQNKILALRPLLDQGLYLIEEMKNKINFISINTDLINKTRNFKYKNKKTRNKKRRFKSRYSYNYLFNMQLYLS
jgi:dimeric dUTPase (all-alpha-NTP-PPase superfamily)